MVPIGRHILKYRPLVLTSGCHRHADYAYPRASGPGVLAIGPNNRSIEEECRVQVLVRDNNVDQALKVLKKKMQREGVFREMKLANITKNPPSEESGRRRRPSAAPASSLAKSCSARVCCQ